MMKAEWGDLGEEVWHSVYQRYGEKVILQSLHEALKMLTEDPHYVRESLTQQMNIEPALAEKLITDMARAWLMSRRFDR